VCWGKNKCAANVCQLAGGFAALLFLRSVGLKIHVGWFWLLVEVTNCRYSMPHNEQGFAMLGDLKNVRLEPKPN
jgi:hypothetical protein